MVVGSGLRFLRLRVRAANSRHHMFLTEAGVSIKPGVAAPGARWKNEPSPRERATADAEQEIGIEEERELP